VKAAGGRWAKANCRICPETSDMQAAPCPSWMRTFCGQAGHSMRERFIPAKRLK